MTYTIQVENALNVIGKGSIIICHLPDELLIHGEEFNVYTKVHVGDKITIDDTEYTIKGIEKVTHGSLVGFIIEHQNDMSKFIGKYIKIEN